MITTIIFDFYGVFQDDVYGRWLIKNGLTRSDQYLSIIQELDSGALTREEFVAQLSALVGHTVTYDDVYGHGEYNTTIIPLVQTLKRNYKIGLLSNASDSLRSKLKERNLSQLFDAITISSEVGVAKPHENIYRQALEMLHATPDEAIFIDDNPSFVQAAQALGITSITFTTTTDLRRTLLDLKVLL